MVAFSAAGAIVFGCLAAASRDFESAYVKSPLLIAWAFAVIAEGMLSGVAVPITLDALRACRSKLRRNAWQIVGIAALAILLATPLVALIRFPLEIQWPLGQSHWLRTAVFVGLARLCSLLSIYAMWQVGADAIVVEGNASDFAATTRQLNEMIARRRSIDSLLRYNGTLIGMSMLTVGLLRKSMIAGGFATEQAYPSFLVLGFGAFLAIVLAIAYAPPHAQIVEASERLCATVLKPVSDLATWAELRSVLRTLLQLDTTLESRLAQLLAVLGPLIGAMFSELMSKP
jgi:hypothetical protein